MSDRAEESDQPSVGQTSTEESKKQAALAETERLARQMFPTLAAAWDEPATRAEESDQPSVGQTSTGEIDEAPDAEFRTPEERQRIARLRTRGR